MPAIQPGVKAGSSPAIPRTFVIWAGRMTDTLFQALLACWCHYRFGLFPVGCPLPSKACASPILLE